MTQVIAATDGSDAPIDLRALAASVGIAAEYVIPYGHSVARIDLRALESSQHVSSGGVSSSHYVVVTMIISTPFGEGRTATAIGLAQGLNRLGQQTVLTLRQSAMGPAFGTKGGTGGSGGARILPAEQMDLHLTSNLHVITAAHNLLSAMIDNHLYHGNESDINERTITWFRVLDVNGRALRHIISGLGAEIDGVTRQASLGITPASELMVITSLATDLSDLRGRLGRIVIGRSRSGEQINTEDLKAAGATCAVLRDALEPNLLRTGGSTPVLVHINPFGNVATRCFSVIAGRVTAAGARDGGHILAGAGFGSDMDLERFVGLRCVISEMHPSVAVVVVTIRTLKTHSGRHRLVSGKDLPGEMLRENVNDVRDGAADLLKHLQIIRGFGITPVIAVNVFPTDHDAEIEEATRITGDIGARVAVCHPVTRGGGDCLDLVGAVVEACQETGGPANSRPTYEPQGDLYTKIPKLADLCDADSVDCIPAADKPLEAYEQGGFGHLPIIVARTPLSLSAKPGHEGVPTGWRLPVYEVRLATGANYVYAICGSLSTMPGLPGRPTIRRIDIDLDTGQIVRLR